MLAFDPFHMHPTSNPSGEIAQERYELYMLLGKVFQEGLTAETLAGLQKLPQLTDDLPAVSTQEAQAAHQALFEEQVAPTVSAFLHTHDHDTAAIKEQMAVIMDNYPLDVAADSPDHIEAQLQLLAYLTMLEAQAWNDDLLAMAVKARGIQRAFLQNHLLRWLPPFTIAVYRHGSTAYRGTVALLWHTVHSHFADVVNYYDLMPYFEIDFELPDTPESDDSLAQSLERLLSPSECGVWMAQHDVAALEETAAQPTKLSSDLRKAQLEAAVVSAEEAKDTAVLLEKVQVLLDDWVTQYEVLNRTYPATRPFVDQWLAQTKRTIGRIEKLQSE